MEAMQDAVDYSGVIAQLWAVGEEGGIDLGTDPGADADPDLGADPDADPAAADADPAAGADDKIDLRRGSKEFREALKAWEATPEGAKFAKQARADHFRAQEIAAIDPGGITAIRDKYALLESIGGPEALTTLQERVAAADGVDEALAAGDPKALESLGPEFDAGLAKLAPTILERIMKSDPEAYSAAILPHLMSSLAGSPMVADLNRMVDALQAPHLDEAGKIKAITALLGRIGAWYDVNEKKAAGIRTAPVDKGREELNTERGKFEQEQQAAHWKNNIQPGAAQFETAKLEELYKPFDARLKLDAAAKADLFGTFRAKMTEAGKADKAYMAQMAIYRKQKNPDPATVQNYVKAAINRHAKTVVENAVKARYGRFLGAKPGAARTVQPGARAATTAAGAQPVVVSVKPSPDEIDYRRTSEADQWKGIYTLKTGKKVQVRRATA